MAPALSKHALSAEEKKAAMKNLLVMTILGCATQNITGLPDAALITAASKDVLAGGSNIALTSSLSGLIEFLVNPILGKLADQYGRKWVYYIGEWAPSGYSCPIDTIFAVRC